MRRPRSSGIHARLGSELLDGFRPELVGGFAGIRTLRTLFAQDIKKRRHHILSQRARS